MAYGEQEASILKMCHNKGATINNSINHKNLEWVNCTTYSFSKIYRLNKRGRKSSSKFKG